MSERPLMQLIQEQFQSDRLDLPVFNPVALELQKMKGCETATMKQIAAVAMKDQAIASRVLRVANSSFYCGLRQVDTISGAVVRLGTERVINMAMVASQSMAHSSPVRIIGDYMPKLWGRTFAAAVGGRWVAQQCGYQSRSEEVFLAGLLHDIGELFLLKALEQLALNKDDPLSLTETLLREVLDALHADMGFRLMLQWDLPEQYARVARDHHESSFDEADLLLVVTRLLDAAGKKLGIGQTEDPDIVLAATPEAQVLGLKDIKLAQLEVMLEDAVAQAPSLM